MTTDWWKLVDEIKPGWWWWFYNVYICL